MGKGVGGSSLTSYLFYVRGNRRDFDHWEELGNEDWHYSNVLEYFKKSEDMRIPEYMNSEYHHTGGYLGLERGNDPAAEHISNLILNAANDLGLPTSYDINGASQIGFSETPSTIINGTRCSTARAFLAPAKDRPNLHVMKNSFVTKLLIENNNQVIGVEVKKNDTYYSIKAKNEVIVSAGVINSPQLLMLSGIGPKEHLEELGIDVVKDLRVGEHLIEHTIFFGSVILLEPSNNTVENPETAMFDTIYEYISRRSGSLSKLKTLMLVGFIDSTESDSEWPDLQMYNFFIPANDPGISQFLTALTFGPEYSNALIEYSKTYDMIVFIPSLLKVKSSGRILLNNTDPFTPARILTGFLEEKEDVDMILKSIRFVEKLVNTDSMKAQKAHLAPLEYENCKDLEFGTDEYWVCSNQQVGTIDFHQVGTCKMGPLSDTTAVVDPRLRVHGINGLRVADASIMPEIIRGNPIATTIMIGEKASDFIKQDWGFKSCGH